ncbi:MAG: helix-turn-helix domain-containing protein [Saccharolobus sp.]|uniref:Bacterio-opsin activator domain-containing protein n=1 Tax=Saccharolobus shibatae (strain ATCC 51178 / DSM 5389 / JCM 8931 / NBRC 15437 / B12) TaxID=523848 RepID=A0A8F5GS85_SACSH|nr:helix-turn-helix domain-containing protein [Saccharolobus shibatae]MCH4815576.1 helix-turn-helix domain-containing protein [Saccharolobus shibatae]QXJ27540.1 Bacterio-opsin activator domain-containing protein [Saccharolobus shibatae B12]
MIRSYNVLLSHDDWTLQTDKYEEDELKVLMKIRTPSFEKMEENIIAEAYVRDPMVLNELINIIKSNNRVIKLKIIETVRTKNELRALMLLSAKLKGGISELLMNKGAYYISERISNGLERWSLVIDDKVFKEIILPDLKEYTYNLKVTEKDDRNLLSVKNLLTSKEFEIIYKAYRMGYFDWPKKVDLKELSEELGISKAATLQALRRAMGKLIRNYVDNLT